LASTLNDWLMNNKILLRLQSEFVLKKGRTIITMRDLWENKGVYTGVLYIQKIQLQK